MEFRSVEEIDQFISRLYRLREMHHPVFEECTMYVDGEETLIVSHDGQRKTRRLPRRKQATKKNALPLDMQETVSTAPADTQEKPSKPLKRSIEGVSLKVGK